MSVAGIAGTCTNFNLFTVSLFVTHSENPQPNLADLTVPEVRRLLDIALPLSTRSTQLRLAWSHWRRERRLEARLNHCR